MGEYTWFERLRERFIVFLRCKINGNHYWVDEYTWNEGEERCLFCGKLYKNVQDKE